MTGKHLEAISLDFFFLPSINTYRGNLMEFFYIKEHCGYIDIFRLQKSHKEPRRDNLRLLK